MNGKLWEIIRREYLERVTKKSFWISTIILPVFMLGSLFLPAVFSTMSLQKSFRIAVIDLSGKTFDQFQSNLREKKATGKEHPAGKEEGGKFDLEKIDPGLDLQKTLSGLKEEIAAKKWEGCLLIAKDIDQPDSFQYFGRNVSNITVLRSLGDALDPIVVADRLARNNVTVPPDKIREWIRGADLVTFQVEEGGTSKKSGFTAAVFITFAFVLILYIALIIYGVANLRGVLEEKTSRIMEVLLATFTPRQIMTGKLVGIGLVGLTQMLIYAVSGGFLFLYSALNAAAVAPGFLQSIQSINPMCLVYFVIFFVLGYFIFSAMFLAVGSLCSTEEDAQNMQTPVIFLLVIPMVSTMFFIQNPDSTVAMVISMIPVFTPMVMLMRILVLTPPLWQILLSIGLCLAFLYFQLWALGKIFRIGILMYGKHPTFKEVWNWIRTE